MNIFLGSTASSTLELQASDVRGLLNETKIKRKKILGHTLKGLSSRFLLNLMSLYVIR